jgi:hypothetical protein
LPPPRDIILARGGAIGRTLTTGVGRCPEAMIQRTVTFTNVEQAMWTPRDIRLMRLQQLLPSEHVIPERVTEVVRAIQGCGYWTDPIRIECSTNVVMDGHHRLAAAGRLSLASVPCAGYTYSEVEVRSRREEYVVDGVCIRDRALSGNPYPSKTTKHTFPDNPLTWVSLENLRNKLLANSRDQPAYSLTQTERAHQ